jgi:hypothetical protein
VRWRGAGKGALFETKIGMLVDVGGPDGLVTEPERDDGDVDACVEELDGTAMPKDVGVGFLAVMEGQVLAAAVACRATMRLMASRLRGAPRGPGNSGSFGWLGHSFIQVRSTLAVWAVSGVARCFRPLPVQVR